MPAIAFVFPGQEPSILGMGKDFYDNIPRAARVSRSLMSGPDMS